MKHDPNLQAQQPPSAPLDDIRIFLPTIGDEEYRQRARIRSAKNIASLNVTRLNPGAALNLCWILIDTAVAWQYAPASLDEITAVAEQCRRLLVVAETASKLEGQLP